MIKLSEHNNRWPASHALTEAHQSTSPSSTSPPTGLVANMLMMQIIICHYPNSQRGPYHNSQLVRDSNQQHLDTATQHPISFSLKSSLFSFKSTKLYLEQHTCSPLVHRFFISLLDSLPSPSWRLLPILRCSGASQSRANGLVGRIHNNRRRSSQPVCHGCFFCIAPAPWSAHSPDSCQRWPDQPA